MKSWKRSPHLAGLRSWRYEGALPARLGC